MLSLNLVKADVKVAYLREGESESVVLQDRLDQHSLRHHTTRHHLSFLRDQHEAPAITHLN